MSASPSPVVTALPSPSLRAYVSHYWLSWDNTDASHPVVPDGAVDLVVTLDPWGLRTEVFGTSTCCVDVPLQAGAHYLGIRFRPGQSRHFMRANLAELIDTSMAAEGSLAVDLARHALPWLERRLARSGTAEADADTDTDTGAGVETEALLFERLDRRLLRHLARHAPVSSRVDLVIRHLETAAVPMRGAELASLYCKSRRQTERDFREAVGLSPKLFAQVVRFRRASAILQNTSLPMADVASVLGYSDQSHMTRAFARFLGRPPSTVRQDAAFLQDAGASVQQNPGFLQPL